MIKLTELNKRYIQCFDKKAVLKKVLFTIVALSIFKFSISQSYADVLKSELSYSKTDTTKIRILHKLSSFYLWKAPDSAIKYSLEGSRLAEELEATGKQIEILHILGEALAGKGNFYNALETQLKALKLSEQIKDQRLITWSYCNIGIAYYYAKDFEKALYYFSIAKGNVEMYLKYKRYISTFIGETYFQLNQIDSALLYIRTAYELDLQEATHWSVPYYYMAAISEKSGEAEKALNFYREGIRIAVPTLDSINGYNGMAKVFKSVGNTDSALYYAKKALVLANYASLSNTIVESAALLSEIFKSQNRIDSAYKYQQMLLTAKDTLFSQEKVKQMQNLSFNEQYRYQELRAADMKHKSSVRLYVLFAAFIIVLTVGGFLWRSNRNKQRAYKLLEQQKYEIENQREKLEHAFTELKNAQTQLIQKEKMASLGELTAGVAHEIQNPLNFINNFSELNTELIDEMEDLLTKGSHIDAIQVGKDIRSNHQKIQYHGNRADVIVKGMLQHSRGMSGIKEPTDINALVDEYLRLSYHALRAKDKSFSAHYKTNLDKELNSIQVVPQDIGRVLLNLFNNAFHSVNAKRKAFGEIEKGYEPTVYVSTKNVVTSLGVSKLEILVKDNGVGIPERFVQKIFQPFFTTKPAGEGTGLGLSLSYDIITKGHSGEMKVKTLEGEGAEFIILLPQGNQYQEAFIASFHQKEQE